MGSIHLNGLIGNSFCCIVNNSGKGVSRLVMAKREKGEITITDSIEVNEEQFPDQYKKLPWFVIINTSQIIQKEIPQADPNPEKMLAKAFPNINRDDFYYEVLLLREKAFIAIARKSLVEDCLDAYAKSGAAVCGFSLGLTSIGSIIPYTETDLHVEGYIVDKENIIPDRDLRHTEAYHINGLEIKSTDLLAFSGILELVSANSLPGNTVEKNTIMRYSFRQKRIFSLGMISLIGFLLTILLVNVFVFNHYFRKEQDLDNILLVNQSSLSQLNGLKDRVNVKKLKVGDLQRNSEVRSTELINHITSIIPISISLTELIYNPLQEKVRENESMKFQEGIIIVKGEVKNNADFTKWIRTIQKIPMIRKVTIANFGKDDEQRNVFSIEITIQ